MKRQITVSPATLALAAGLAVAVLIIAVMATAMLIGGGGNASGPTQEVPPTATSAPLRPTVFPSTAVSPTPPAADTPAPTATPLPPTQTAAPTPVVIVAQATATPAPPTPSPTVPIPTPTPSTGFVRVKNSASRTVPALATRDTSSGFDLIAGTVTGASCVAQPCNGVNLAVSVTYSLSQINATRGVSVYFSPLLVYGTCVASAPYQHSYAQAGNATVVVSNTLSFGTCADGVARTFYSDEIYGIRVYLDTGADGLWAYRDFPFFADIAFIK